jgi:hypothetical protein
VFLWPGDIQPIVYCCCEGTGSQQLERLLRMGRVQKPPKTTLFRFPRCVSKPAFQRSWVNASVFRCVVARHVRSNVVGGASGQRSCIASMKLGAAPPHLFLSLFLYLSPSPLIIRVSRSFPRASILLCCCCLVGCSAAAPRTPLRFPCRVHIVGLVREVERVCPFSISPPPSFFPVLLHRRRSLTFCCCL